MSQIYYPIIFVPENQTLKVRFCEARAHTREHLVRSYLCYVTAGATSQFAHLEKFNLIFSTLSFVVRWIILSILAILVPLWFIISSLFFSFGKLLFSEFLQFKDGLYLAK